MNFAKFLGTPFVTARSIERQRETETERDRDRERERRERSTAADRNSITISDINAIK